MLDVMGLEPPNNPPAMLNTVLVTAWALWRHVVLA